MYVKRMTVVRSLRLLQVNVSIREIILVIARMSYVWRTFTSDQPLKHKDSFGKSENLSKIFFAEILVFDHDY